MKYIFNPLFFALLCSFPTSAQSFVNWTFDNQNTLPAWDDTGNTSSLSLTGGVKSYWVSCPGYQLRFSWYQDWNKYRFKIRDYNRI
jgi:hypothetical protein